MVNLIWRCGEFITSPHWMVQDHHEAQECTAEFTTKEDEQDWDDGVCSTVCVVCENELDQSHAEVL